MGAAADLLGLLASPFGTALVISSGLFCSIAGRNYAGVQRRLDACQHRLEERRREHQRLQQRLLEHEPGRGEGRPSKGLETLGRDGGWR